MALIPKMLTSGTIDRTNINTNYTSIYTAPTASSTKGTAIIKSWIINITSKIDNMILNQADIGLFIQKDTQRIRIHGENLINKICFESTIIINSDEQLILGYKFPVTPVDSQIHYTVSGVEIT